MKVKIPSKDSLIRAIAKVNKDHGSERKCPDYCDATSQLLGNTDEVMNEIRNLMMGSLGDGPIGMAACVYKYALMAGCIAMQMEIAGQKQAEKGADILRQAVPDIAMAKVESAIQDWVAVYGGNTLADRVVNAFNDLKGNGHG